MKMAILNPNWIVGFVDGDGHFGISNDSKRFYFVVSQDQRSVNVLYAIKQFFKCGSVHKAGKNMIEYKVSSKKHLENIIIPFFQKWPLQTSKKKSFEIFVKKFLKVCKPTLNFEFIENSNFSLDWFRGFIDAEGCFVCSILNQTIRPQFIIGLNAIDKSILDKIQKNLKIGVRYKKKNGIEVFQLSSNQNMCHFAKSVLLTKGFKDHLKTYKRIRARKWCRIVFLMEQKKHKTIDGFNKIQKLYKSF
uniref:Putative LAGLIDADG homing endonuclease n=1 Tax=Tydemania expeditionis TaxID=325645 RepID=A0A0D6E261_TYDEX|nr:putative LAGLIDADG homing endonuclease [Tydemania expeditionis]CEO91075.1 putative LAGLIDADG homing endonuclease [Tydemania expeditionis]